jgi:hypothetical protein
MTYAAVQAETEPGRPREQCRRFAHGSSESFGFVLGCSAIKKGVVTSV